MMEENWETEPNDTIPESGIKEVQSGDDNWGYISPSGDEDMWMFKLPNKAYINLYLGSIPSGNDYDIYLYGGGTLSWKGIKSGNTDEVVRNLLLNAGTYYVKIDGYSTSSSSSDPYLMRWRKVKQWPVLESERITQYFSSTHNGLDIGGSTQGVAGDTIVSMHEGTVARSGSSDSYGYVVYVNHNINGEYVQSRYAHMNKLPLVSEGQTVIAGTKLGEMGNTGYSNGVHLHFETRKCDGPCPTSLDNTPVPVDPLSNYFPEYQ